MDLSFDSDDKKADRKAEFRVPSNLCSACGYNAHRDTWLECHVMSGRTRPKVCCYCTRRGHDIYVCHQLHSDCYDCGGRGHRADLCHARDAQIDPQYWLKRFLTYAHRGMHTGYNVGGPMSGRWGYGPVDFQLDQEAELLLTRSKLEIFNNLIK